MNYRINRQELLTELGGWNLFLKRKIHLIACGGTALTLLNIKESTKDIDFLVPNLSEYDYLITSLQTIGYKSITGAGWRRNGSGKYIFDLFRGNKVHTTELLDSPLLPDKHIAYEEFTYIYVGILNFYDILISKLFRGDQVDFEDCKALLENKKREINIDLFKTRFIETASYDISREKALNSLKRFLEIIKQE